MNSLVDELRPSVPPTRQLLVRLERVELFACRVRGVNWTASDLAQPLRNLVRGHDFGDGVHFLAAPALGVAQCRQDIVARLLDGEHGDQDVVGHRNVEAKTVGPVVQPLGDAVVRDSRVQHRVLDTEGVEVLGGCKQVSM